MNSLIILSLMPLIGNGIFSSISMPVKKKNTAYLWFCGICIVFVMGLRWRYTGTTDTDMYCRLIEGLRVNGLSLSGYIQKRLAETTLLSSEIGFYSFAWIIAKVFYYPQYLILFSAVIVTACVMRFIRLYSKDCGISVTMYICLGLLTFNMNGMRQAIAMAICLIAYDFIVKKRPIPFVLTILVAMSFHKTAIIFLPFYLITYVKYNFWHVSIFMGIIALFYRFSSVLIEAFDDAMDKSYATAESFEGGGIVVVAIYICILILAVMYRKALDGDTAKRCFFMTITGFALYCARYFSAGIFERVSYYFFYYSILLLPEVISKAPEQERRLVKLGIICLSTVLFIYRVSRGAFMDFKLFFN